MHAEYQIRLPLLTPDTATGEARPLLQQAQATLGFIPNMYGAMAHAPALLATYFDGYDRFRKQSGFTPAEQEVILLTISRFHGCTYCVAAHSMIAEKMSKVPVPVLEAIRAGAAIPDAKLRALSTFVAVMVETRGLPARRDVEAFLAAGYQEPQILAIILAIAVKTISNFTNHLFHTPVDAAFAAYQWTSSEA